MKKVTVYLRDTNATLGNNLVIRGEFLGRTDHEVSVKLDDGSVMVIYAYNILAAKLEN